MNRFDIPIALTWLRVALIPVFVSIFYLPESFILGFWRDLIAVFIFLIAAWTDWLDGFLARRWNVTSDFGAFLDPVADKLIVSSALILLVSLGRTSTILALIIIGREIAISALREWMGRKINLAVVMIGKLKTTAQMVAITLLLYFRPISLDFFGLKFSIDTAQIGNILMFIAAVLTIWSMLYYLRRAAVEFDARLLKKAKDK